MATSPITVPPPRYAGINPNQQFLYSDGISPFNGYALIQLLLPKTNSQTWPLIAYGNLDPSLQLPVFQKIPILFGQANTSCGLWYNTDLTPPGSGYIYWLYDATDTQVAGPSSTFFVNSSTVLNNVAGNFGGGMVGMINLPTLTPTLPNQQQLSVTPDAVPTPGLNS